MTNYGKTETELLVEDSVQCRQIVKEITKFGVSQPQMIKIIELLAMELENIEHVKKITSLLREFNALNVTEHTKTLQEKVEII